MPTIELTDAGLRLLRPLLRQAIDAEDKAMDDLRADDSDRVFYPPYIERMTRKWHYEAMLHQLENATCPRLKS
jgi:hypothetical protein